MAGDTQITVVGNLTADPELRFTNSGVAVASFRVASTPRTYNRQTNQWENGTAMFLRCTAWRTLGENCAETLKKGMHVIVQGRLVQNNWQTAQGENRSSVEIQVDEVGPSLRYATAQVQRTEGGNYGGNNGGYGGQGGGNFGGNGGFGQQSRGSQQNSGYNAGPQGGADNDPWAAAPGGSSFDDQPPF
ncbi:single-stranded DNA-binding protein [Nanchangia anserum]|uniref:Single-stranded DNA-binding protein n=1 Tax=Nanchangia anserum TaxID=2692125 RepID=A0A8I0GF06_9ACTO|nr:single-stranded DNA-binding protein [Nanchangia anserum]MBD3689637.1 single-stranded DNA-binding protein [Nanchangia anserum]QOX81819.1 single-stranded DNA-binding protein [Nanchangia anserum]